MTESTPPSSSILHTNAPRRIMNMVLIVAFGMPLTGRALADSTAHKMVVLVQQFQASQTQPSIPIVSPDPQIAAALKAVSAQQIQRNIEMLVSFQTRLTLSAQDPASISAGRGIGAARKWIESEFQRYSKDCGGCLEVKTDSFTQAPADRIPKPTEITNVHAVLKGTDPDNAKRIVLVTDRRKDLRAARHDALRERLQAAHVGVDAGGVHIVHDGLCRHDVYFDVGGKGCPSLAEIVPY